MEAAFLRLQKKVFCLCCVFVFCGVTTLARRHPFDSYPEPGLEKAVRYIGENPVILYKSIDLLSPVVPGLAETYRPAHGRDISPVCDGCLNVISFVKTLIRLGVKWEAVREQVILLCKVVVAADNTNGDILCPPTMDNLGPIVIDVLRRTKKNNKGICIHMNWCDEEELPSYVQNRLPHYAANWLAMMKNSRVLPDISLLVKPENDLEGWQVRAASVNSNPGLDSGSTSKGVNPGHANRGAASRAKHHALRLSKALKVAHLTDVHVEEKYLTGAATDCHLPACCRPDTTGKGSAGPWGAYTCNVPPRTIERFFDYVADMGPDFVIFSGDDSPHAIWVDSQEVQMNSSKWVAATMRRHFPNTTIYPNIGNHENFPINMYFMERPETQELNTVWGKVWTEAAGFGPEQNTTIHMSGYYTTLVRPGLRIVAYNSNYCAIGNFYTLLSYDLPEFKEMVNWMKRTLKQARKGKEHVIITSHHPYGAPENVIECDEIFTAILANYSDIIVWHPVGHIHRDEFRINFDPHTGEPVGVVLIAQTLNTLPNVNPGFRIFYLDPVTHQPLDYDQYYIDLVKANTEGGLPEPKKLYRATEEYGLRDLSPPSFLALHDRMKTDPSLLTRYWRNQVSGSGLNGACDDACMASQMCHLISPTLAMYRKCMAEPQQQAADPGIQTSDAPGTDILSNTESNAAPTFNLKHSLAMACLFIANYLVHDVHIRSN